MGYFVEAEIASQPDCWRRAADAAAEVADVLRAPGARLAFAGCGTSWFVAQVLAAWREDRGLGESDAFAASEMPDRRYDRLVTITRSGTTTEVVDLLARHRGRTPTAVLLGTQDTPAADAAEQVVDLAFADEQSVVQTRFATTAMALGRAAFGDDVAALADQLEPVLTAPLPDALVHAEQITFLGRGWSVGLAHEAALKFRETSSSWAESYPAMDYRHGPISIAAPGRAVWMFGEPPPGLADEVRATGAEFVSHDLDPMVDLVLAQRVAVARAVALGADPDQPTHLTRSIVLTG